MRLWGKGNEQVIKKMLDEEQSETSNRSNFRLCSSIRWGNVSLMDCLSKIVLCFLINKLLLYCSPIWGTIDQQQQKHKILRKVSLSLVVHVLSVCRPRTKMKKTDFQTVVISFSILNGKESQWWSVISLKYLFLEWQLFCLYHRDPNKDKNNIED